MKKQLWGSDGALWGSDGALWGSDGALWGSDGALWGAAHLLQLLIGDEEEVGAAAQLQPPLHVVKPGAERHCAVMGGKGGWETPTAQRPTLTSDPTLTPDPSDL